MTRIQKIVLIVFAVIDLVVIGALGVIVVRGIQSPPVVVTPIAFEILPPTLTSIPTWTPTPGSSPTPTLLPQLTRTPRPTRTALPTPTETPLPTPGPVELVNGEFDLLMPNRIPGWEWYADVNYRPGGDYDPQYSFAEPMFSAADDPVRRINGSTLKIETVRWLKFRAWVHQTVSVTTGSTVYFQVKANAFSSIDNLVLRAGIDPNGNSGCDRARWGEVQINQDDGIVTISTPRLTVGEAGRVTVCLYAEPLYPDTNNAAFFDQAVLIASPPQP
ncbi:MAG: hypothetical protein JXB35_17120 [Anaerolineae bacterium]|nr:hypothetical protein [Anaerolineae bacterium]